MSPVPARRMRAPSGDQPGDHVPLLRRFQMASLALVEANATLSCGIMLEGELTMASPGRTRTKSIKTAVRASEAKPSATRNRTKMNGVTPEERLLGGILGQLASGYQAAEIVERGLPTASVDVLRNEGLTFSEVHDLVLPARTLKHRIIKNQPLSIEETDRTLRVAKVLALAEQVFGSHDKALGWLRRPNRRLKDRTPMQLLRSEVGGEFVRQMLYQIDEGIYV